jgi:peptidoglycan/xylan/chitin deacetylase (PgdA/CDA1 family)
MRDVLVLCYHAVSEDWTAPLSVRPEQLAHQLESLVRRGYRGATFSDAVTQPSAGRTLAVTFDDAFLSVGQLALPILSGLGLPGTVFVPTDFPDSGAPLRWPGVDHWLDTPHARELEPLSWSGLRELADRGWEVGSHTRSHPHLTGLEDGQLADELAGARQALEERMGRPCPSIAYPYGEVDARVVAAAGAAGYVTGAGLPPRIHSPRPLEWPRVGIYHVDSARRFAVKVSPTVRRLLAWPPAASALARSRSLRPARA